MKKLIVILFILGSFFAKAQVEVLIVYNSSWGNNGTFNCTQDYAGAGANFTLCPMPSGSMISSPGCFTGLGSYDMIMIQATYSSLDAAFINDLINYIQAGGSVFFQNDCGGVGSQAEAQQNINDLLGAIGQPPITLDCSGPSYDEVPTVTGPCVPFTPTTVHYATGGFMSGPALANATMTAAVSGGTYQGFWPTGFGGTLGIGTEFYTAGNWAGSCTPGSGEIVWNGMNGSSGGSGGGCDILAQFSLSLSNICEGNCIDLTDESTPSPGANLTTWDYQITGGTPSSSNNQNPTNVCFNTAGTYDITLTVTDDSGASDDTTMQITVDVLADATITPVGPFCETDPTITLTGADPGGTWTGTGITNGATGDFDPATAGPGTHTITYTIAGTCGDVQTTDIVVNPQQDATITPAGPFCENDPTFTLTAVDPGGTWTGTGITNGATGDFDPATAGVGTFTITYTIAGTCGDVQTTDITVNPQADATITPAGPFCVADVPVNLTAVDAGGTWTGTGITDANLGTFDPATAGIGTHTITYTIAGACGDVQTVDIDVNASYDATITPAGPFCENDPTFTLTAVDPGGTWSGTGITNGATGDFDPATAGPGTFTITYTITGVCGDMQTTDIVVDPIPDATISSAGPFCVGDPALNLNAVDAGGTWSGTGITDPNAGTFDPATAGVGTHVITYTIGGGCGAMDTENFVVNALDDATINPAGPFCLGNNIEILTAVTPGGTWSGTGITDPATGEFTPLVSGEGTFTITYTTSGTCANSSTIDVSVLAPLDITAFQDMTICEGQSADISAIANGGDGNLTITWMDDQGNNLGTNTNLTVSPITTTTYTATVTDGCTTLPQSDQVTITVDQVPVIDFTTADIEGCAPLNVNFVNNTLPAGTNCTWDFGDGSTSNNCGNASHQYNSPGCYDVTLTVSEGNCTSSQTIQDMVCVYDIPIASFSMNPPGSVDVEIPTVTFENQSINASSYLWTFGDNTSSTAENPTHDFPGQIGTYTTCLKAVSDGGCADSTCQVITVTEGLVFYVPNVFTPDGDAYNEQFKPVFTSGYDIYDFHFTIFNRWGEVVWESYDASKGWNGHYGSRGLVEDGVYIWKVEFGSNQSDKRLTYYGHVTVLK